MLKVVDPCINTQLRTSNHVEVCRCNMQRGCCCPSVPVSCADLIRIPFLFWGHLKSTVYESNPHTMQNWRTTSATQLQPSRSCYIGYTSTWWQHDCWLTVQTLYAIYIPTSERISQGHVQNGRRATFSWPTLYKWAYITQSVYWLIFFCG